MLPFGYTFDKNYLQYIFLLHSASRLLHQPLLWYGFSSQLTGYIGDRYVQNWLYKYGVFHVLHSPPRQALMQYSYLVYLPCFPTCLPQAPP